MKRKVYFILSSLRAGGSERVFWLLSQYFNKDEYDVSLILLDMRSPFFSPQLDGIRVVDLKSIKVSKSFFKLYRLIKKEKPHAIFTTGGHLNTMLSLLSLFVKIPVLVGREASVLDIMSTFEGTRDHIIDMFVEAAYKRIDYGVCQSHEVQHSLATKYHIPLEKLVIIPNPVLPPDIIKVDQDSVTTRKELLMIARLANEKGIFRALEIMRTLPHNYSLTIVGEGPLREEIEDRIEELALGARVHLVGQKKNVYQLIACHDVLVLTSFTEGFPNVALEALSVGIPVISFRVGGISAIIENGFNGYIVEQDDLQTFRDRIVRSCNSFWDSAAIRADVHAKFGIERVVASYENLIA